MRLTLFTQEDCSACKILKRKLQSEEVEFEEIYVTAGNEHGINSTPVLMLSDEDGEVTRINGYDPRTQEDDVDVLISEVE